MNFDAIGAAWAPRLLSILRIMGGLMLFEHGTAKLLKFPVVPTMANLDLSSLPGIAGFFELIGGVLLVVGLFTRPVAFILVGHDGGGLFLRPCAARLLSDPERRRVGRPLLLRLPLSGGGRSRPVEHRRRAQQVALNAPSFGR